MNTQKRTVRERPWGEMIAKSDGDYFFIKKGKEYTKGAKNNARKQKDPTKCPTMHGRVKTAPTGGLIKNKCNRTYFFTVEMETYCASSKG